MSTAAQTKETNGSTSLNPFGAGAKPQLSAVAEAESNRQIAEIQAAMTIAQRFPRSERDAVDRILNAFSRVELCEKAMYEYARGGTDISGLSIRAAEAIAQQWGNMQFGIRELDQRSGHSTVQAYAWDLQTNVREERTFHAEHIRHTRSGQYRLEDPRDIYEMVANQGARRLRACILAIIPIDVQRAVEKQIEATLVSKATITPERIASTVDMFAEYGVDRRTLENFIQRNLDSITPLQLLKLGRIYTSIKDGVGAPKDYFKDLEETKAGGDAAAPTSRVDELKQKHGQQPTPADAAPAEEAKDVAKPEGTTQPAPEETTPPRQPADEKNRARELRTQIMGTDFGKLPDRVRQNLLKKEYAKTSLTDLSIAQLEEVLARVDELVQGAP